MPRIFASLRWLLLALPMLANGAHAQEIILTGPTFAQTSVNAGRFDAIFAYIVPVWPMFPLFRNQPEGARFDAVVCIQDETRKGAVRVSGSPTLGHLKPGECTMFVNVSNIEVSRPEGEYEWRAKVYLRAYRSN